MDLRFGLSRFALASFALAAVAGCGRSGLLEHHCTLTAQPGSIDFGSMLPSGTLRQQVTLRNEGDLACTISDIAVTPGSDPGFSTPKRAPLSLDPGEPLTVEVDFFADSATPPLTRNGTLRVASSDVEHPTVDVALHARLRTGCSVSVDPTSVDFGHVKLYTLADRFVTITNHGVGPCSVDHFALASDSDPAFTLGPGQPSSLMLQPNASAKVYVDFSPTDFHAPHHRTGTLVFDSNDDANGTLKVPLSGDIDIGCSLTITPPALGFGNVMLNNSANASVTLGNDGSDPCHVRGIALEAGTDPGFTLPGAPTAVDVAPGGSAAIPVRFDATDSAPPHLKTGAIVFATGDSRAPDGRVPLSAYVNTLCVEASQWIYTVDDNATLSRFDPLTLSFDVIGTLSCPTGSTPNSMALDQNGTAWVSYQDGNMFSVDITTAACSATSFQPDQFGLHVFGMGFVFDPTTGTDTLYIDGGQSVTASVPSTLATVSFPDLKVSPVGSVPEGFPELTGTGDGELWGFFPKSAAKSGTAELLQLDPKTGKSLARYPYPTLATDGAWAVKFWGGSFWIFLGTQVIQVDRNTPKVFTVALPNSGHNVVGAGVSTCAPVH